MTIAAKYARVQSIGAAPVRAGAALASLLMVIPMGCTAVAAERGSALIWHIETDDGKAVDSNKPDEAINPASVTMLATSLRALDKLGADHRFTTTFGLTGDAASASTASLVIDGGADPDFHFENAMLVARALLEAGISRVRGDVFVGDRFWIGWERGSAGRELDPGRRREDMGRRLVRAWSPRAWSNDDKVAWAELARRHGWNAATLPAIQVDGQVRIDAPPPWRPVLVHRSEPLLVALRRFNVFSNNDIERLDDSVGPATEMAAFLQKRLGKVAASASFATSSGLNRNRVTPRLVVHMLRDLRAWLTAHGHTPAEMMPVLGCGESTLTHLFPDLRESGVADGLIGKTGTLTLQDGGVSALAGYFPSSPGLVFFVAKPNAGSDHRDARAAEQDWVRRMLAKGGQVPPVQCGEPVPTSEAQAVITRPAAAGAR